MIKTLIILSTFQNIIYQAAWKKQHLQLLCTGIRRSPLLGKLRWWEHNIKMDASSSTRSYPIMDFSFSGAEGFIIIQLY